MGGNQSSSQGAAAGGPQGGGKASPAPPSGAGPSSGPSSAQKGGREPKNKVQLAVSQLGGIPGAMAYHSSVVVNGEEFFFSDGGISSTTGLLSHKNPQQPDSVPQVFDVGMSHYSGSQLRAALEPYFLPGTYDLLKKNCNSFSDCALFYLLHTRLDKRYRALEKLGASAAGLVQTASGGQYAPNPKAVDFDVEKVVTEIDPEKIWSTPGQATGGVAADSAEAMRAARLARFGGGGGGAPGATVPSGGLAPAEPTPAAAPVAQ